MIRQAIKGYLQILYYNIGIVFQLKLDDEDKVRVKFYYGFEIDEFGFVCGIVIEREKMKELKKELKVFLNDKRLYICMIILKVERGVGGIILCL